MQSDFMEQHYHHFDDDEENKFIYTDIHKQYVSIYFDNLWEASKSKFLCLQQSLYFLVILWRNILDWGFWVYSSSSTAVSLTTVVKTMQIQKAVLVYTDSLAFRIPNEDQTMFVIIINCFSKWKKLYGSL